MKVTGISPGTATITAKLPNGKAITNSVVVKNKSLSWVNSVSTLKKGQKYTFRATTNPSAAITYSSSDSSVATIDYSSGVVVAKKKGTTTIYANENGLTISMTVTIK